MSLRRTLLVLLPVAALALAACGRGTANGSSPVDGLDQIQGVYVSKPSYAGTLPTPVVAGSQLVLTISGSSLGIQTGCNQGGGQVSVQDSHLVVAAAGGLAMTEMACPEPLMAQERWVGDMLLARPRMEQSGPYLHLLWGTYWMTFERTGDATPVPTGAPDSPVTSSPDPHGPPSSLPSSSLPPTSGASGGGTPGSPGVSESGSSGSVGRIGPAPGASIPETPDGGG